MCFWLIFSILVDIVCFIDCYYLVFFVKGPNFDRKLCILILNLNNMLLILILNLYKMLVILPIHRFYW